MSFMVISFASNCFLVTKQLKLGKEILLARGISAVRKEIILQADRVETCLRKGTLINQNL